MARDRDQALVTTIGGIGRAREIDGLQLAGALLCHAQHATAGFDAGDRAFAEIEKQAVRIPELHPKSLARAQLVALAAARELKRLGVGSVEPLVPLRGLQLEALDHFVGQAVAFLCRVALIASKNRPREDREASGKGQRLAHVQVMRAN